jgi:DNA sulfur modification protein DndD
MDELVQSIVPALDNAKAEYDRISIELMDRGGAWAVNRDALKKQIEELQVIRLDLEEKAREQLAGVAIFALAPKLSARVIQSLEQSHVVAEQKALMTALAKNITELKKELAKVTELKTARAEVNECIDSWAKKISQPNPNLLSENFGLSDADAKSAITSLALSVPIAQRELVLTSREMQKCAVKEEELQDMLAHAPSDESLNAVFEKLKEASERVVTESVKRAQCIEDVRRKIWAQIEVVRKLKKLQSSHSASASEEQGENIVDALHDAISDFSKDAAIRKCDVLCKYFLAAFKRLARKGDIVHDAQICPEKFKVTLLDKHGVEVPKKRLSAGEKQIYAIAMLEALGKASGRNLPVIIDTPLGRLDTQHRQKLVDSYFASASHQVIILSTDTEIDLSFYEGLEDSISHGYHLIFEEAVGASRAEEGYFWKTNPEVFAHVA